MVGARPNNRLSVLFGVAFDIPENRWIQFLREIALISSTADWLQIAMPVFIINSLEKDNSS